MQDANIPGLNFFGEDQAVRMVEERFKLDDTEEEALSFFAQLIEQEMSAWGAVLIDRLHGFSQGWGMTFVFIMMALLVFLYE